MSETTIRDDARNVFKKYLTYVDIEQHHLHLLQAMLEEELYKARNQLGYDCNVNMWLSPKIIFSLKEGSGISEAYLYVSAHYFNKREAISFNKDGFIGLGGELSDSNIQPILYGFTNWVFKVYDEKLKQLEKKLNDK